MKKKRLVFKVIIGIFFILVAVSFSVAESGGGLEKGNILPPFNIKMPENSDGIPSLDVKGAKVFPWTQIQGKLLVIVFFEVFCPVCQGNAPQVNRLYRFIQEDKDLNRNIKMLGISLGSGPADLAAYKEKFKPEFPVFSDYQKEIQTKSKVNAVPLLIVVDKNGKIFMSHLGSIKDLDPILADLRKLGKGL